MWKIKINLNAIKSDNSINKVITNHIIDETNPNIVNKDTGSPPENKSIKEENIIIDKKIVVNKKIELNSIKKTDSKLEKNKTPSEQSDLKLKKAKAPPEKIRKPLFENYESVFKKDKTSILEHIKRLKQIPKTNIILLTILITITIAWIWFLFSTNPKIHNFNNYKTSILDTYNAIYNKDINWSWSINNKIIKKEINKWWYIYNIKIQNILWKNVYIYNWQYYESENKLNIVIDKETVDRKKIKLVKILKNSFSK